MLLPFDLLEGGHENRGDKCELGCFCYRWPLGEGRTASKRVSIHHLEQTSCNEPKLYQICDGTKLNIVNQNSAGEHHKKSSINIDNIAVLVIIIIMIQIIIDKFQVCPFKNYR